MDRPFDLEAAKRGEPVEYDHPEYEWVPCHFVGTNKAGFPVVETDDIGIFHPRKAELRMAPTPDKHG